MKQEKLICQQGDALFFEIEKLPSDLKVRKDMVALDGLKRHVAEGNEVAVFDGYISTTDLCLIKHPEHKEIVLPPGNYEVRRVVEYSHMDEESRAVVD